MAGEINADKKKLHGFLLELSRCFTVKGFQHFTLHPRSREELLFAVKHQPTPRSTSSSAASSLNSSLEGSMHAPLPRNEQSLLLSTGTQKRLSGYGFINVGLPPASPSGREALETEPGCTLFMLACYQRYNCPYVWVRSNHDRLVHLSGSAKGREDNPLKLHSTSNWANSVIHPWDIMAEVINLCMEPSPANPFAVDLGYFEQLPMDECILATGAMANMLRKILLTRHHPFDQKVSEDLKHILHIHFTTLCQYATAPSVVDGLELSASSSELSSAVSSARSSVDPSPAHAHTGLSPRTQQQPQAHQPPAGGASSGMQNRPAASGQHPNVGVANVGVTNPGTLPAPTVLAPQASGTVSTNLPPLQFTPPTVHTTKSPERPPTFFGPPPSDSSLASQQNRPGMF